ncbi:MAG: T9SS type A sorting domain-containing protein, partial [Bacteroidia bacterium]
PNATFAEDLGNNGYNYWKSTSTPTTQLELLGIIQPSISFNLNANSAIAYIWPVAYGYNKSDAFSGSVAVQTPTANLTGTATGNLNTLGSGSGTVVLPGGLTFNNVLQVTSTQTINASLSLGPFPVGTATITSTNFQYFHSTQKFPILSVNYQLISGSFTGTTTIIRVNNKVFVGIEEATQNFNFSLYPNPATNNLNIAFSNNKAENVSVKISNNLGQTVKTVELGNSTDIESQIDLSTLSSGVYFVKTTVGKVSSTKKLIKE